MISVIIPTYNRAHILERAVRSVLAQEGEALEVIVVDDGSTDDTQQVLAAMDDPRIRYERLPGQSGACAARNRGIELAQGEYIAFQDSDDEWLPGKLTRQRQQLEETGADVVFCAFERYNVQGERTQVFPHEWIEPDRVTYEQLLFENLCSTQTIMGRRACFEEVRFDPTFPRLQDWEMMLRMVKRFDVRYFSDVLVRVHEQPDSISARPERMLKALKKLYGMHRKALCRSEQLTWQMLTSIQLASNACGRSPWRSYLYAMSRHLPLKTNAQLLRRAIRSLLSGLKHLGDSPKERKGIQP